MSAAKILRDAIIITVVLGVPALIGPLWQLGKLAGFLVVINLPGILAAVPYVPPEGYPGQSFRGAAAMLLIQFAVWYIVLTVISFIRSRFDDYPPEV